MAEPIPKAAEIALDLRRMAEPARIEPERDEPPIGDPAEIDRARRLYRAQRQARLERQRATKRARLRFWSVLLALLLASLVIAVTVWLEIERQFGL
jgi:hypothetical protein